MTAATSASPHVGVGLPDGLADDLASTALVLARRLSAGATLWCASPAWPHHAQHVAVEFVHPVVVGKPALPAVALSPIALTATARANARAGDVLLVIGPADDAVLGDVLVRAPAWGVTSVWIGSGPRPAAGAADHVLWLPDDENAAHDGRFILLYHLLWELSHVCIEHAGAGGDPLALPDACGGPVCITCSDEGRLAEVMQVSGTTARVRTADGTEDVDCTLVESTSPYDLLVCHAGMAITRLAVT